MNLPKDLFLVRHGEILTNEEREILTAIRRGRPNPGISLTQGIPPEKGLTSFGVKQAKFAKEWLENTSPATLREAGEADRHQFWVAPFDPSNSRCHETNRYLGVDPDIWQISTLLKDREWGADGSVMVRDALRQQQKEAADPFHWSPSGDGTSTATLVANASKFLELLKRPMALESVVISCHGEVIIAFQVAIRALSSQEFNLQLRRMNFEMPAGVIAHFTRKVDTVGKLESNAYSRDRLVCPWDPTNSRDNGAWLSYE